MSLPADEVGKTPAVPVAVECTGFAPAYPEATLAVEFSLCAACASGALWLAVMLLRMGADQWLPYAAALKLKAGLDVVAKAVGVDAGLRLSVSMAASIDVAGIGKTVRVNTG